MGICAVLFPYHLRLDDSQKNGNNWPCRFQDVNNGKCKRTKTGDLKRKKTKFGNTTYITKNKTTCLRYPIHNSPCLMILGA